MDFTNIPRALIYRDKKNLDDFIEANELNSALIKNMAEIEELLYSDFEEYALICMNAAYYICTIFMLEKHPVWRLSKIDSYIGKLNLHPVAEYKNIIFSIVYLMLNHYNKNWQDNNGDLLEKIYVCIYPEEKNARAHIRVYLEGSKKDILQTLETNLPPDFVLPDDEFSPRIIDKETVHDALATEGFSWVKLVNHFEERSVRDIVKAFGNTEEEKHNVVDLLRQASHGFYTAGYNDYPEKVDKMLDYIDEEIFRQFTPNDAREITEEDKAKLIIPIDLEPYEARIKELENENERLRRQLAQQPVVVDDNEKEELRAELKRANQQLNDLKEESGQWFTGNYEKLSADEIMTLRERVVFFSTVLSLELNKKYTILSNLATFISELCNDQNNVVPFISKMKRPGEAAANAKAARKVANLMKLIIPEDSRNNKHLKINQLIDSMLLNFPENEDD